MKKEKYGQRLICAAFGVAVAAIVWITLISRQQEEARHFLPPLHSYLAIARGNRRAILENVLNILLFLPVGFCLPVLWNTRVTQTAVLAFAGSLTIELLQLVLKIGFFEVDDLFHNTLGAVLGYQMSRLGGFPAVAIPRRYALRMVAVTIVLAIAGFTAGQKAYTNYHTNQMRTYAAMQDRKDTPNLLVLDGKPGYAGNSGVLVRYLKNGSISVSGTSDIRSWKVLAELELEKGTYSFSGLSGVAEKTVAIELEYYNEEIANFTRLTVDVGPVEETTFTLSEKTRIRAYVGVYPGCRCNVVATPVIYREGD